MKIIVSHCRCAAFTLVEIALALAIIGFALVAIIGVLPFGLNVQRENREETIIVQDANYLLDAIRNGARGLDDLTNYVDGITNYRSVYQVTPTSTNRTDGPDEFAYTVNQAWVNGGTEPQNVITNGERIIGLLSTPRYEYFHPDGSWRPYRAENFPREYTMRSNYVIAYIRALSGPAIEKSPQTNNVVRDLSLRYRLIPEIAPFENWNLDWVDFNAPGLSQEEVLTRSNAWRIARQQQMNTHEVRLLFRWPVTARGIGNQRQVFRTIVSGNLVEVPPATNDMSHSTWLMQPAVYTALQ